MKDEGKTIKKEVKHEMIAGGLGGLISRFLVAPLDQVKIKKQVDIHGESSLSILRKVIQSQGILRGLWKGLFCFVLFLLFFCNNDIIKGNSFAIVLWSSYGAIQFPIYEQTRKQIDLFWPFHHTTSNMIRYVIVFFFFLNNNCFLAEELHLLLQRFLLIHLIIYELVT